jgi:hypothetical protein
VEFLDHMAIVFLIFWGTSTLISIVAISFCIPSNDTQGFQFLCIFANTCYFSQVICLHQFKKDIHTYLYECQDGYLVLCLAEKCNSLVWLLAGNVERSTTWSLSKWI